MGLKNHPLLITYIPQSRWRQSEARFALGLIQRHPRLSQSQTYVEALQYVPDNTAAQLMGDLHLRVTRLYNAKLRYRDEFESKYVDPVRECLVDQLLVEFVASRQPHVGSAALEVYRRKVRTLFFAIHGLDEAVLTLQKFDYDPSRMLRVGQAFLCGYDVATTQASDYALESA